MNWQPIESAPKDGSQFLAYDKPRNMFEVLNMPPKCVIGVWAISKSGEWFGSCVTHTEPTHWMPLPEAPK